jgi:hypothetical protein
MPRPGSWLCGGPEQPYRVGFGGGSSPAIRSPSRWEQLIPAACMNVARPSSSAQPASQVARSRLVSSRGSPLPPSSARVSGFARSLFNQLCEQVQVIPV